MSIQPLHNRATYDFSGSVLLVTGAAGDIGRAVAGMGALAGARLALADHPHRAVQLEATASHCRSLASAAEVETLTFDVTQRDAVVDAVQRTSQSLGLPNLLFNNAGVQGQFAPTDLQKEADIRTVLEVNVVGLINVLQAVAEVLKAHEAPGSIVNSASMAHRGAPNMLGYSASKGAVVSLTRTAAIDLAPFGLRVNSVSPAFIGPGEMWSRQTALQAAAPSAHYSDDPDIVAQEMIDQVPLGRLGSLDDVAGGVTWLLSDGAAYVTGHDLVISGGIA